MSTNWKQASVCRIDGYERDSRANTGKGYETISLGDVFALVEQPGPDCPKGTAPAVIYSTYCADDARSHSVQKEKGSFVALCVDIDDGSHALETIVCAVCGIDDSEFAWAVYSTASATENSPRWRVIVPLASPLSFERWAIAQRTLGRLLGERGIESDIAAERAGQAAILPISKPFYQAQSNFGADALDIQDGCRFEAALLQTAIAEEEAKSEEAMSRATGPARKLWEERRSRTTNTEFDPIQWFNQRCSIAEMLVACGYVRKSPTSNDWRSPRQLSESYATRDFGDYWVSLSSSDAAAGLGVACGSGRFGDAFDLSVHFEHNGGFSSAVKAAAALMPSLNIAANSEPQSLAEREQPPFEPLTADDLCLGGQDRLRKAINAEGRKTPSSAAYSLAMLALKKDLDEHSVSRLLLTPENRASEHCLAADNPAAEAKRIVDWANQKIADSPPDKWKNEAPPEPTGLNREDFYFIAPQGKCIYLPTRELWPTKSIDGAFKLEEPSASDWFAQKRLAEQMIWAPGEPQIIGGRLMTASSWHDMPGATVINTYQPGPYLFGGDPAKAGPWLDLIKLVYPNEMEHLLDCFAQRVQRPQEKINHAIVLGGQQGIGKDSILEPVKEAVGHWNWADISPSHAMGRFNGFLKSIVLRISEARDLGDHDRFAFYDRAKTWMASPPDVHTIDEKNLREYPAQNVTFVIITTNRQDALHLEPDDRRHFVAWSDLIKEDFSNSFWTDYYRWLNKEGGKVDVAAYLQNRDISRFDAKSPPPKTSAFWAILQAGQSPETLELSDVLEEMSRPSVICTQAIEAAAGCGRLQWFLDVKNAKKVRPRLAECGYEVVPNPDTQDGRWRFPSGAKRMVYVDRKLRPDERVSRAWEYVKYNSA